MNTREDTHDKSANTGRGEGTNTKRGHAERRLHRKGTCTERRLHGKGIGDIRREGTDTENRLDGKDTTQLGRGDYTENEYTERG